MDRPFHTEEDVPVTGGRLRVGLAGPPPRPDAPAVLAVHGITASHRSWSAVARRLGQDLSFLAPDLRGRGGSSSVAGSYGLGAHVADLRTLDSATAVDVVWRSWLSRESARQTLARTLPAVLTTADRQMDEIVAVCRAMAIGRGMPEAGARA